MVRMLAALLVTALFFTGFQNPALAQDHGKPSVEELEQQFKDLFNFETEDGSDYLKDYDTKDEVQTAFENIMVPKLAEKLVNIFYVEENGDVRIIPQDSEKEIDTEQAYDLEEINSNHYKLSQTTTTDMHGTYTLTVDYIYESDKWIMANRRGLLPEVVVDVDTDEGTDVNSDENAGDKLPNTATSLPTSMMIGGGIMLAGAFLLVARRRAKA